MVFANYNLKTLSKNGFVRLPKAWLNEVNLTTGDLVDIYYRNKRIYIERSIEGSSNNQRYINRDKRILIPQELRKQAKLIEGCPYLERVDLENQRVIIDTNEK